MLLKTKILNKIHIMRDEIKTYSPIVCQGKVNKVLGMSLETIGPKVNIDEMVNILNKTGDKTMDGQVVGFKEGKAIIMPFGSLDSINADSYVQATRRTLSVPVGDDLIGRIVDGLGEPIDDKGPVKTTANYPINGVSINPTSRPMIDNKIKMGVRSIDALLTCGKGQRIGIFAGSGVGKSTLMGMLAQNVECDVNVIALVGERGREVMEFIHQHLGEEGLKKSVVIVATSDQSALIRYKCALCATSIAEYFRDSGKDVLLMMDSLTRFAMAHREIGLSIGELPVSRGYTPSLYTVLPKLLERAGKTPKGTITGVYTVLVDGDDFNEPVSDAVRSILDGHIILSRELASQGIYPAIDILASVSRLMPQLAASEHINASINLRKILSTEKEYRDIISIGAYKKGGNADVDYAIDNINGVRKFLKQKVEEKIDFDETIDWMKNIGNGGKEL